MTLQKIAFAALMVLGVTTSAMAADVNLTINGELTATTCKLENTTGTLEKTVALPILTTNALASAGATAGRTPIDIAISGCAAATAKAILLFEGGGSNITATGGLANTATATPATNVEIQLLDAQASVLNVNTAKPEYNLTSGAGNIRMFAQYFSPQGGATAGAVNSKVAFSIQYN